MMRDHFDDNDDGIDKKKKCNEASCVCDNSTQSSFKNIKVSYCLTFLLFYNNEIRMFETIKNNYFFYLPTIHTFKVFQGGIIY